MQSSASLRNKKQPIARRRSISFFINLDALKTTMQSLAGTGAWEAFFLAVGHELKARASEGIKVYKPV
ncbi:MAG: hypothetical protein ACJA0X_002464 [Cyclobacteriaceae bacterium]|jgi:hypothetical protein